MQNLLQPSVINNCIKQFDNKGFVVLSAFLNHDDSAAIAAAVNTVFDRWFRRNQDEIKKYGMVNMHSLTHPDYFTDQSLSRIALFNAISPKQLVHAVNGIFGDEIYFHNTQLFFNPLNDRLPYWHRDMQYNPIEDSILKAEQHKMTGLHVPIPLVAERGVELIPGSHRRWDTELERNVRLELNGHKNSEDLPGSELIELDVGDVLVFDAQMIHRGNYDQNKERKALDLCIGSYHPLTASHLDGAVFSSEKELSMIHFNEWFVNAKNVIHINSNKPFIG